MKLPFDFSLKFIFRIVLPGFVLALSVFPLVNTALDLIGVSPHTETTFVITVLILGWLFIVLDMSIYMFFEGRRYWPNSLWQFMKKREEIRINKLKARLDDTSGKFSDSRRIEALVELRDFPVNDNFEYFAKYPTRLGNLLASYEDYSSRVYGMDATFYWHRIWLTLDKDVREEMDTQQAIADSAIYVSMSLFISGLIGLVCSVINLIPHGLREYPNTGIALGLSIAAFPAGYFLYRSSLHIHSKFGELFKSIFDVYHEKINVDTIINNINEITGDERLITDSRKKYREAWRYLRYSMVKKDGKVTKISDLMKSR